MSLNIEYKNLSKVKKDFNEEHIKLFGFFSPEKNLIIESIVVELNVINEDSELNLNLRKKDTQKCVYKHKKNVYMKNEKNLKEAILYPPPLR